MIITQLAVYTTYIPLIYCQLDDYMLPSPPIKGTWETPLIVWWRFFPIKLLLATCYDVTPKNPLKMSWGVKNTCFEAPGGVTRRVWCFHRRGPDS